MEMDLRRLFMHDATALDCELRLNFHCNPKARVGGGGNLGDASFPAKMFCAVAISAQ